MVYDENLVRAISELLIAKGYEDQYKIGWGVGYDSFVSEFKNYLVFMKAYKDYWELDGRPLPDFLKYTDKYHSKAEFKDTVTILVYHPLCTAEWSAPQRNCRFTLAYMPGESLKIQAIRIAHRRVFEENHNHIETFEIKSNNDLPTRIQALTLPIGFKGLYIKPGSHSEGSIKSENNRKKLKR